MAKNNKPTVKVLAILTPLQGHPFCILLKIGNAFVPSPRMIEFHQHSDIDKNQNVLIANNLQRMLAEELLAIRDDENRKTLIRHIQFLSEGINVQMDMPYDQTLIEQKIQKVMERCFAGEEVIFESENAIPA